MKYTLLLICLLTSLGASAQETGMIRGIVVDEEMDGEPLQMASIKLEGTTSMVRSNFFGDFEISAVVPGTYELQISFAGYETVSLPVEVRANEITQIQQGLVAETIRMEELLQLSENKETVTASLTSTIQKVNKK